MNTEELKLGNIETLRTEGGLNGAKYYSFISEVMRNIHSKIPLNKFDISRVATSTDIREEQYDGLNCKRATMFLLTNGCEWALKNGNGCTVCGHLSRQTRMEEPVPAESLIKQFYDEYNKIDFSKYPVLNLYNNGSFFNENEIAKKARIEIIKIISKNPYIKTLVLETRPEFVDENKINEIINIIPDKYVEIAIGLEMIDDSIRTICLNKGFSLSQYNKAVEIIISKAHLKTYVMLKPPFLNERESIVQAVKTIEYAFEVGSSTVSLEACTIQDYTLPKYMSDLNLYRTSWLWSIVEVIKRTAHLGKVIVGMFQFYPSPHTVPYNCDKCSEKVIQAIRKYNKTLDIKVFDDITCDCKEEWKKEVLEDNTSINDIIDALYENFYGIKEKNLTQY